MNPNEPIDELLLRKLDGRATPEQSAQVSEQLRADPAARAFLRDVAEQAVMVVELERIASSGMTAGDSAVMRRSPRIPRERAVGARTLPWILTIGVAATLLVAVALGALWAREPTVLRVTKVTGSSHYFGANGRTENSLAVGAALRAGDTLETRSCDSWIELELSDLSTLTIAGQSTLRIQRAEANECRFTLLSGNLWVRPGPRPGRPLVIESPVAVVEAVDAQFDLQTSSAEMIVRVNKGSARVVRVQDGLAVAVPAAHQTTASLGSTEPLEVLPQPKPTDQWACNFGRAPQVLLGDWLPPTESESARLGAEPLLWPIPNQNPLTLFAVALAASQSSERPVLLHSGSSLRVRGRTVREQTVRFGFSAQRMRGVFAGKFELDVLPASLGPAGQTWEVTLPLAAFRPLHPELAASPQGLELTDVYALTINQDAGLEVNHVELLPPK